MKNACLPPPLPFKSVHRAVALLPAGRSQLVLLLPLLRPPALRLRQEAQGRQDDMEGALSVKILTEKLFC